MIKISFLIVFVLLNSFLNMNSKITFSIEKKSQWISLCDENKWKGYNKNGLPDSWEIKDGVISCNGKAGDKGGDIITFDFFDNFELQLEWKISKGGNSGILYHIIEDEQYHSPYQTGPEFQVLDDAGFPNKYNLKEWQKAGADYAMHKANDKKTLKPVGEWNTTRIIYNNKHVEYWLNGKKIVEFERWTGDWFKRKSESKWASLPHWGMAGSGHIGLQDHGSKAWFRNMRVRRL